MSIFTNIKDFKGKDKILVLLYKLEDAHKRQDELSVAVLLTQLDQNNIKIVVDNKAKIQ